MIKTKPRIGDVIEIKTAKGYAYGQLTHKHHMFGYLIRILPDIFDKQSTCYEDIISNKELYYTFLFKEDLYDGHKIKIVANCRIPDFCKRFPLMRDGVVDPSSGRVLTWWLWDGRKEWPIEKLEQNQYDISLRHIWNSDILINRIENSWRPSQQI